MRHYIRVIAAHPLLRKSILYTVTDAINKAIPFLVLPLLTYYLSPADYGIVSNYTVYLSILLIFVGLNTNGALIANFYHLSQEEVGRYMYNIFLLIAAAAGICGIFLLFFAHSLYSLTSITPFFLGIALIVALGQAITQINLDLWRMEEKPLQFGIYQIAQSILNVSLTIVLVVIYRMGWQGRLWAVILTTSLFLLISLLMLYKRGYLQVCFDSGDIKDALKFGIPMIPHALGIWIRTGIDRIFITKLYGTAETGLYSTGFQFGLLLSFLVMAFHNAYTPYVYKILSTGDERKKVKIVKFTYGYFIGINILALLFTIISVFVVEHFLPASYKEAGKYVGWAMFAQAFQGMYFMVGIYIFYAKRTAWLALSTTIIAILQLILSFMLVKYIGPIGAAYSSCIMGLLNVIMVWIFSNKVYPMPWFNPILKNK